MTVAKELVRRLTKGEDVSEFIHTTTENRTSIAERGIHIEALLAYGEPIVIKALIDHSYATEHYDEWVTHPDKRVRYALAKRGYVPEIFIRDVEENVRLIAASQHPEYIPKLFHNTKLELIARLFVNQDVIDVEQLREFLLMKPEVENQTLEQLTDRQVCIPELIALDNPYVIKRLIVKNLAKEHYDQWKNHPERMVRQALASKGYFPEHFINDDAQTVKVAAVKTKPELMVRVFGHSKYVNDQILGIFLGQTTVDVALAQVFLDTNPDVKNEINLEALRIQISASQITSTLMGKTMSIRQQFESGYHLWARGWKGTKIAQFLSAKRLLGEAEFLNRIESFYISETKQ